MRHATWLIGFALIALGCFLLLRNLRLVPDSLVSWWPAALLIIGLFLLARRVGGAGAGSLMPGVILTIYGAFLLLVPLGIVGADDVGRYWGVFPGGIGAAFLVRYLVAPEAGHQSIVPAIILLAVGALGLSETLLPGVWRFWPVVLIVVGLLLLTRRRR